MLHVMDGTWVPNKKDQRNRLEPGFGATIMIINGGIECGHGSEKPQALHRQAYYRKFAEYFKVKQKIFKKTTKIFNFRWTSATKS